MYQAVYAPHILVSLPNNTPRSSTTSSTQSSQLPLEGVSSRTFFDQCVDMTTTTTMPTFHQRNHHTIMPPPPHSYLNNNSSNKNYNTKNQRYWNKTQKISASNAPSPENGSGDCGRSPTPRGYESDDSCKSLPKTPDIKGNDSIL